MRFRKLTFVVALTAVLQLGTKTLAAQDLGHKLPGLIGLDAGRVPEPGLYVVDRVVSYDADQLRDRNGNRIPTGPLRLTARANAAGLSYTFSLRPDSLFWSVAAAAPVARFSLNVHDRPEASVDRFGLSDIYILPVRMGWRRGRLDVVASYAVYLPTGTSPLAGGRGVSSGQITHQFALGGSVYAGKDKDFVLTALASYDLNRRKRDIDITRGDVFQFQGGAGLIRFARLLEVGAAGYGLWQVRDDRGADLPPALRGARNRAYGAGPEVAVFIKAIRSQIRIRYEWDLAPRSRPKGAVFSAGITFVVHRPRPASTR